MLIGELLAGFRHRSVCRLGVMGMILLLGGCQSVTLSDLTPFGSGSQPCPNAAPLVDAVNLTEFGRGNARDESNIVHTARIEGSVFDCDVSGDRVRGRLGVAGSVTLGRKGQAGTVTLPIFIALTRSDSEVVSKRFDTVEVEIERGETTAQFEKVIPDYEFNLAGEASTLSYEILTGFNLRPDQVEYNRKQLGG